MDRRAGCRRGQAIRTQSRTSHDTSGWSRFHARTERIDENCAAEGVNGPCSGSLSSISRRELGLGTPTAQLTINADCPRRHARARASRLASDGTQVTSMTAHQLATAVMRGPWPLVEVGLATGAVGQDHRGSGSGAEDVFHTGSTCPRNFRRTSRSHLSRPQPRHSWPMLPGRRDHHDGFLRVSVAGCPPSILGRGLYVDDHPEAGDHPWVRRVGLEVCPSAPRHPNAPGADCLRECTPEHQPGGMDRRIATGASLGPPALAV